MAFSIKNDEADSLARKLADLTGESLTDAVLVALRERLRREELSRHRGTLEERIRRLQEEAAALPVLDDRSAEDILAEEYAYLEK